MSRAKVLFEISIERGRQETKWGEQNHPILDPHIVPCGGERMCEEYGLMSEWKAKQRVDSLAKGGNVTYMHILVEEICEIASATDAPKALRKELIQAGAVIVAMVESLDRNGR